MSFVETDRTTISILEEPPVSYPPSPSIISASASPSSVVIGGSFTVTVVVANNGGTGTVRVIVSGDKSGSKDISMLELTQRTFSWTFTMSDEPDDSCDLTIRAGYLA